MKRKWYVGIIRSGLTYVPFNYPVMPTEEDLGHIFISVIGPFSGRKAAFIMAAFGKGNPHLQHASDANRIARNNPQLIRDALFEIRHRFGEKLKGLKLLQAKINESR